MRMALLHRGRAHRDEAAPRAQLLDVPGPTIPHPGTEPADQLIDEPRQRPLVRDTPLDALGHQLVALAVPLTVAVLRAGHHGPQRAHAAVRLEAASLVENRLPRALGQAREQAAEHDRVRP